TRQSLPIVPYLSAASLPENIDVIAEESTSSTLWREKHQPKLINKYQDNWVCFMLWIAKQRSKLKCL
ncbi:MAG: hypothetical protein QXH37_07150, partial [Candidatus Bathyarchaeia archaeon]